MKKLNNFLNNSTLKIKVKVKKINVSPIMKRIFKKQITNATFIASTVIFLLLFFIELLIGNFYISNHDLSTNSLFLNWLPLITCMIYLGLTEINYLIIFFRTDVNEKIVNIEIRSGISTTNIYFFRIITNRLISFIIISCMLFIYLIFGYAIANNFYTKMITWTALNGMVILYLYDFMLFAILLTLIYFNSSLMSFFATCLTLSLIASPLLSTYNFNKTNNNFTKQDNYKLSVFKEIQDLKETNRILAKNLNDLYQLREIIKIPEELVGTNGFYSHNQISLEKYTDYHFVNEKFLNPEAYISEIMSNGLITEINNLNIYKNIDMSEYGVNPISNMDLYESNSIIQLINYLKNYGDYTNNSAQIINASLFTGYAKEDKKSDAFLSSNNYFSFTKEIQTSEKNQEIKEIVNLVSQTLYLSYTKKYSSITDLKATKASPTFENTTASVWKYDKTNENYNNFLVKDIEISDEIRTFSKVYLDLLTSYASYEQAYDASYTSKQEFKSFLNPLTGFSRTYFETGFNSDYNKVSEINPWSNRFYSTNLIKKNITSLANEETGFEINTNKQYLDNELGDSNISKEELEALIITKINDPSITKIDVFTNFKPSIKIEKTEDQYIVGVFASQYQMRDYYGYIPFKITFDLVSQTNTEMQKEQKKALIDGFESSFASYSSFFNKLKNSEKVEIILINNSFYWILIYWITFVSIGALIVYLNYLYFKFKLIN